MITAAHLMSSGGLYGAEHMFLSLAGGLRSLNCHVRLGVFHNAQAGRPALGDAARQQDIETAPFHCQGRWDWSCLQAIRSWLRVTRPDVVHCHGYKADLYGYAAARGLGIPLVATCHNWTNENRNLKLYAHADRVVLRRFHHVAAVSANVETCLIGAGVPARKLSVIGNGVPVEAIASAGPSLGALAGESRQLVGAVGRMVESKGFDVLLRAIPRVIEEAPGTKFVLVGDGPERERLEAMAAGMGLRQHLVFTGVRGDMPGVYRSLSQFVLPSFNEGMPMSVLEAMAASVPVVATRVGALPELIGDAQAGMLVNPGEPGELAGAILQLLRAPAQARSMGLNGYAWVRDRYSSRAMAQTYLKLYESLLGEGRSSGALVAGEVVDKGAAA